MTDMFSNGADLSGLLESGQPLQVSDVVHKAIIEIDEEGATAAAATSNSKNLTLLFDLFFEQQFYIYFRHKVQLVFGATGASTLGY